MSFEDRVFQQVRGLDGLAGFVDLLGWLVMLSGIGMGVLVFSLSVTAGGEISSLRTRGYDPYTGTTPGTPVPGLQIGAVAGGLAAVIPVASALVTSVMFWGLGMVLRSIALHLEGMVLLNVGGTVTSVVAPPPAAPRPRPRERVADDEVSPARRNRRGELR